MSDDDETPEEKAAHHKFMRVLPMSFCEQLFSLAEKLNQHANDCDEYLDETADSDWKSEKDRETYELWIESMRGLAYRMEEFPADYDEVEVYAQGIL